MTYEQFLNEADSHIEEIVIMTCRNKATGKTRKFERVNWDGRKGWVENPEGLFEIISCEWK